MNTRFPLNRCGNFSVNPTRGSLAIAGLLTVMITSPAGAADVSAWAEYYQNANLAASDQNSSNPVATAFASGDNGYGGAYSASDGILNVSARTDSIAMAMMAMSFPPPSGAISATAVSIWEDQVTNGTGQAINYSYIFHVANPRLGTQGNAGDYAALSMDIFLDGTSIWEGYIIIDGTDLNHSSNINAPVTFANNSATFSSFDIVAPLGTFAPGASFEITYEMKAYANAANLNDYVFAAVGDPAYPYGEPIRVIPESSAALLGGLGVLALLRRRRGS